MQIQNSLSLLYPVFADQVNSCIIEAHSLGLDVYAFETYRSPVRQEALYELKNGTTNARSWLSWHQYGLAVDLAFGGPKKWTWKGPVDKVIDLFKARGFKTIGPRDPLHFEYAHDLSIFNAKKIVLQEGVLSVWQEIESLKRK